MRILIVTLAILVVGVYGKLRCYKVEKAPTTESTTTETTTTESTTTTETTTTESTTKTESTTTTETTTTPRPRDCIDDLQALNNLRLQPFIDAVTKNADALRIHPNYCETLATALMWFATPPAVPQSEVIRNAVTLNDCLYYYSIALNSMVNSVKQAQKFIEFGNNVTAAAQEVLAANPDFVPVYQELEAAVKTIFEADMQQYVNYNCLKAGPIFPANVSVQLCTDCVTYAFNNWEEVKPKITVLN